MVSKMYAGSSLLKLVILVLIIIIALYSLIMHKVCGQYANMILFKKEHKTLHNMRIV